MNQLQQVFEFGSDRQPVRVIFKDDEPWWVAADVCECLEHSDTSMALRRLDDDEKGTSIVCTPGGRQEMLIVNEPGLYHLILTSRTPKAKTFRRWVTHEVLPKLRRTGVYEMPKRSPRRKAKGGELHEIFGLALPPEVLETIRRGWED